MHDKELFRKCVMYGKQTLKARRKFLGLLPEVALRRLYERKGFCSVYEFAAKLAGVSRKQVDMVLRLEKKFDGLPVLRMALTTGKVSPNKLVRIASIATRNNQEELVERSEYLSSRALEVFVKDCKKQDGKGLDKAANGGKCLHVQNLESGDDGCGGVLNLDGDVRRELSEMQEKGIDVNAFLREVLAARWEKIVEEKARLAQKQIRKKEDMDMIGKPTSRYVPVAVKRIVREEFGTKCSVEGCYRLAVHLHHENSFAEAQVHDPRVMRPLCKGHHELRHYQDKKFRQYRLQFFT